MLLIAATAVFGFSVGQAPLFIFVESLLNLVVLLDFCCRLRLLGVRRFIEGGLWNLVDAFIVLCCLLLFAMLMVSHSLSLVAFEEVSEELLLVLWSLGQTLRIVLIAKRQKLAQ